MSPYDEERGEKETLSQRSASPATPCIRLSRREECDGGERAEKLSRIVDIFTVQDPLQAVLIQYLLGIDIRLTAEKRILVVSVSG